MEQSNQKQSAPPTDSAADLLSETPAVDPNIKPAPVWQVKPPETAGKAKVTKIATTSDLDLKHWKKYYEFPERRSGWFIIIASLLLTAAVVGGFFLAQRSGILNPAEKPAITLDEVVRQQKTRAQADAIAKILNIGALLAALMFLVGIPVGVARLGRRRVKGGIPFDQRSGAGNKSDVPLEVRGWSWGPFSLSLLWGFYHGIWSILLLIIPVFNLFWILVLGVTGRERAWCSVPWLSFEHFDRVQKKWSTWGLVFLIFCIALTSVGLWFGTDQIYTYLTALAGRYMP